MWIDTLGANGVSAAERGRRDQPERLAAERDSRDFFHPGERDQDQRNEQHMPSAKANAAPGTK